MGAFKLLRFIRIRFFWPQMRTEIITWVHSYSRCISANVKNRESTSLVHSWLVTTPFAIIFVDIWKSRETKNTDGFACLLNSMCDMCQFAVTAPTTHTESSYIARVLWNQYSLSMASVLWLFVTKEVNFEVFL